MRERFGCILIPLILTACTTAEPVQTRLEESSPKSRNINDRVEEKREVLRACFLNEYEKLSSEEKRTQKGGVVKVAWLIGLDGKIKGEPKAIIDGVQIPAVTKCLIQTIKTIRFDPIEGGGTIEVAYPFRFSVAN